MSVAGIDSHKDTLAVAVIDDQGRELDRTEIENSHRGHHALIGWLGRYRPTRVGIEGSGSNGQVAALRLQDARYEVVEVPPQLTAQARRRQRTQAKSDPIDAADLPDHASRAGAPADPSIRGNRGPAGRCIIVVSF